MSVPAEEVIDESGRMLRLLARLDEGTEGIVYTTDRPDLLVKLRRDAPEAVSDADYRANLRRVLRLDLDGIPVARPESLLRSPHVGFVMRYQEDLRPLGDLLQPPDDVTAWWRETHGTEGRLRELGRFAAVMALLHRRGMVVGDVSARNVLGGPPNASPPVVLIDPDGLRTADQPPGAPGCSPPHVAPEVFRGHVHTTMSDVFALATLVAHVLLVVPPFVGDVVHAGPVDGEAAALAGELPWIHDRDDSSNATQAGFAPESVLTTDLRDLLDRTFGIGRLQPAARPSAASLALALLRAADASRECADGCDRGPAAACAICGRPLPSCPALVYDSASRPAAERLSLWRDGERRLERRTALGDLRRGHEPVLSLRLHGDRLHVERVGEVPVAIVDGPSLVHEVPVEIDAARPAALDVGARPSRRFELVPAEGDA